MCGKMQVSRYEEWLPIKCIDGQYTYSFQKAETSFNCIHITFHASLQPHLFCVKLLFHAIINRVSTYMIPFFTFISLKLRSRHETILPSTITWQTWKVAGTIGQQYCGRTPCDFIPVYHSARCHDGPKWERSCAHISNKRVQTTCASRVPVYLSTLPPFSSAKLFCY